MGYLEVTAWQVEGGAVSLPNHVHSDAVLSLLSVNISKGLHPPSLVSPAPAAVRKSSYSLPKRGCLRKG